MVKNGIPVDFDPQSSGGLWATILMTYAPFLLIIAFWIFMVRQMQSGGNKALSFGKSRAKLLSNQQKRVTFKDVAGVEEAKEERSGSTRMTELLVAIVRLLKNTSDGQPGYSKFLTPSLWRNSKFLLCNFDRLIR